MWYFLYAFEIWYYHIRVSKMQLGTYILGTYLVPMLYLLTYVATCKRVYDVFSNICRFDAYNTLINKLNLY